MDVLTSAETSVLLDLAESALAGTRPPEWWAAAHRAAAGPLFHADGVFVTAIDATHTRGWFTVVEPVEAPIGRWSRREMPTDLLRDHPLTAYCQSPHEFPVVRVSDLVSSREWRATGARRVMLDITGVDAQLGLMVAADDDWRLATSVVRQHPFTRHELDLAIRLHRLMAVAGRHTVLWGDLSTRNLSLASAPAGVRLTPRELVVLGLMADGLLAATIARRMCISVRTVHRHQEHVYRKLGVNDRLGAVLAGQRLGLLGADAHQERTPTVARA